jgi:hypothetical protein
MAQTSSVTVEAVEAVEAVSQVAQHPTVVAMDPVEVTPLARELL